MTHLQSLIVGFAVALFCRSVNGGSPCPAFKQISPCYCTILEGTLTTVICPGISNTTELREATTSMKSMIVDRLMLLGSFKDQGNSIENNGLNIEVYQTEQRLPDRWLSSMRVKELDIQRTFLSNCFLCDNPFDGQSNFLTFLSVKDSSLEGNLCSTCSSKPKSVSTKEFAKIPNLKHVDLSYNKLELISGFAFPHNMAQLEIIILSYNVISKIHDNAFANLQHLSAIDLSHNQLTTISRKMFRIAEDSLKTLDISWNSIQQLPPDLFHGLRALKEFKMNHNLLEVLSSDVWSRLPGVLEKIDVKDNFLVCNCSMSWLGVRLSKSTKLQGKCVAPKEVEFQEVKATLSTLQQCTG